RHQLPDVVAAPVLTSDAGVEVLSKLQRDMQIYWAWNEKFAIWLENQFIYCFIGIQACPLPLFPKEILSEVQPVQEPTPDKVGPSTKPEKKKKRKSHKKKKLEEHKAPVDNSVPKLNEEP
ncbi:hypothetical protein A2U01_0061892, partial [Trifolium medium]|nr:hypothetical protein [Trifolium medium]